MEQDSLKGRLGELGALHDWVTMFSGVRKPGLVGSCKRTKRSLSQFSYLGWVIPRHWARDLTDSNEDVFHQSTSGLLKRGLPVWTIICLKVLKGYGLKHVIGCSIKHGPSMRGSKKKKKVTSQPPNLLPHAFPSPLEVVWLCHRSARGVPTYQLTKPHSHLLSCCFMSGSLIMVFTYWEYHTYMRRTPQTWLIPDLLPSLMFLNPLSPVSVARMCWEKEQPSKGHITEENWLALPQKPSVANSASARRLDFTSSAPPSLHA